MLKFRLACPGDAEALVHLNLAFNGVEDVTPQDVQQSLRTSGEIVVVAEADGRVAGFCCAQVHRSFCYPTPVAEVTEMYVDEDHRRKGCASGMLRFLEAHLRDTCGADELHLLTGTDNAAARSAYRKAGFAVKNELCMCKDIARKR